MTEIWKDIPNYEGLYQVSNLGDVRSLDRVVIVKSKTGISYSQIRKGKILKPSDNGGYLYVNLCKDCVSTTHFIHRLVAEAFVINVDTNIYVEVNHKNGNKHRNVFNNLEWVTPSENMQHAIRLGLNPVHTEQAAAARRKPVKCVNDGNTFESIKAAALYYNTTHDNIVKSINSVSNKLNLTFCWA